MTPGCCSVPIEHGVDVVDLLDHQVHRRPRRPTSAARSSTSGKFPWADDARRNGLNSPSPIPAYHGVVFTEALKADRQYRLHHPYPYAIGCATTGGCQSPFASFLTFLLGLETLHLRMERHSDQRPEGRPVARPSIPAVAWVNYPGLPKATRTTPWPANTSPKAPAG